MTTAEPLVPVRVLGLPLDVYRRASQHHDELLREFSLIAAAEANDTGERPVPARLLELVDDLTQRFGAFVAGAAGERERAMQEGRTSVDLVYEVPAAARDASANFLTLLEEADEFCRHGDLLTLAAPAEVVAFREWFLGEFIRQIDGEQATPWSGAPGG